MAKFFAENYVFLIFILKFWLACRKIKESQRFLIPIFFIEIDRPLICVTIEVPVIGQFS